MPLERNGVFVAKQMVFGIKKSFRCSKTCPGQGKMFSLRYDMFSSLQDFCFTFLTSGTPLCCSMISLGEGIMFSCSMICSNQ